MAEVVLQAGHCFRITGSTGTRAVDGKPTEQEVAWTVCINAATRLLEFGHHVRVIKADPANRLAYAGDAFVAVHCDGSVSPQARGASVGYRNEAGQALAHAWKRAYARGGWVGFRPDNYTPALQGYYGTRRAIEKGNRAACIVELGFLTSPADERELSTVHGTDRAATAIVDAVLELLPAPQPPTPPESEEDDDTMEVALIKAWYRIIYGKDYDVEVEEPDDFAWHVAECVKRDTRAERYSYLKTYVARKLDPSGKKIPLP